MKKFFLLTFSLSLAFSATAQTTIDKVMKTFTPDNSCSFFVVSNHIFGIESTDGQVYKFDKLWNQLEKHDAGQTIENCITSKSSSRTYEYNSSSSRWNITGWKENDASTYQYNTYSFTYANYSSFYTGDDNCLNWFRMKNENFLSSHDVNYFSESMTGIAGQISGTYNRYIRLYTELHLLDWDGNILQTIILPYYILGGYPQILECEDKTYMIIGATKIYNKNIIKDIDIHNSTKYNIDDVEVEPEYYHYFIYEYDKATNSINYIQTSTSKKGNLNEIGRFTIDGKKIEHPQKGVNIILYSDGTSRKVFVE